MAEVSVLIPNYNHAHFLKERIDSVLRQTYQDFELIILDDCSTDNSKDIIEGYRSDLHVTTIVYNKVNSGSPFKQWQKGISLANGKYIWIAESDDWCEPTLLEELVNGVKENDGVVISYCGSVVISDRGEILYTSENKRFSEVKDGTAFVESHLLENNQIFNASMAIFNKASFNGISLEFTRYKFCGDWLFWIMLAQKGRVHISGKLLNYFRKHQADVSGRSVQDGTYFLEYSSIVKYLVEHHLINEQLYYSLLFKKYKELKDFEFSDSARKELSATYLKLIGTKNMTKFKSAEKRSHLHDLYIKIWIITPGFIKNTIRKIVPAKK